MRYSGIVTGCRIGRDSYVNEEIFAFKCLDDSIKMENSLQSVSVF